MTNPEMNPYRLPSSVVPSHYMLHLKPDLETETFTGDVEIAVQVSEPVTQIVLNAKEMDLTLRDSSEMAMMSRSTDLPTTKSWNGSRWILDVR